MNNKKLTDEQIAIIWLKHSIPMTGPDFIKVVRDIELAQNEKLNYD